MNDKMGKGNFIVRIFLDILVLGMIYMVSENLENIE